MANPLIPTDPARHAERVAAVPAVYKRNDERMACELVLRLDDPDRIFTRYGYGRDQALALLQSQEFAATLSRVESEMKAQGLSFRAKARAIAEDLLPEAYALATDEQQSASVRADLIQWFARMGDLEPAPKKGNDGGAGGGGLTLNIMFAGQPAQAVVTQEPITLEAGQ